MIRTQVRMGIETASEGTLKIEEISRTVGEHIASLSLEAAGPAADRLRAAMQNPHSTIEMRSGDTVQVVTPDTPLREVLPPDGSKLEITVSEPHAGG
jgi:hypothetical protein